MTQGAAYLPTMAETVDLQLVLSAVVSKGQSALKKPPISLAVCGTLQVVFQFQKIAWRVRGKNNFSLRTSVNVSQLFGI